MISLACIAFLLPWPQQGVSDRIQVDAEGAHVIREYRTAAGGAFLADPAPGTMDLVVAPRWTDPDGGLAWICNDVAVGDDGATVMAGKDLNNQSVTLYPAGSSTPILDSAAASATLPQVAVADRAGLAAAFVAVDTDPAPGTFDYVATVSVWSTAGGAVAWSHSFPSTENTYGGGVAISDDGNLVLAWKANPALSSLMVEAFLADGTPVSSGLLSTVSGTNTNFNSRQTRLSDDGSRAYFALGPFAVIYDVASATVEYEHNIGASFDSHALSGDGACMAFGNFGQFQVWEESSPGVWTQRLQRSIGGAGTYVAWLDLDQDGSHLAFQVQQYSPAYDQFQVGLLDLNSGVYDFVNTLEAAGTTYQLAAAGVELDDDAQSVASINWGDSFGNTPEGLVFDNAGNVTTSLDQSGSGFGIGLDADGDVFAMGTKAVHANEFGNGGAVLVADAQDQIMHLPGYPQVGGSLQLQAQRVASTLLVAVCTSLGSSGTPFGPTEIDLSTEALRLGPYAIPVGGLDLTLPVPNKPGIIGRIFHLQGGVFGGAPGQLTNKVSVRILP